MHVADPCLNYENFTGIVCGWYLALFSDQVSISMSPAMKIPFVAVLVENMQSGVGLMS